MFSIVQFYIRLSLLKEAPQNAPYSKTLFRLSLVLYYLVGVFITALTQAWFVAIVMSLLQLGLLVFLTNLLLWIRKTPERFEQTMSALAFSGVVIGIVAMPILAIITTSNGENIASMLWGVLIIWEAVVIGHIYRHSMEISFFGGIGISFVYMYLSFAVTLRLMKIISAPFLE